MKLLHNILLLTILFISIASQGYAHDKRGSTDFVSTLDQIEGDVDLTTLSDWSMTGTPTIQNVTGGTFELVTPGSSGDHALGTAGGTNNISSSTGWTWETRFRIDSANQTGPTGNAVWEIFMRDNDSSSLRATRIQFYAAGIGRDKNISATAPDILIDLTDDFHVVRGAVDLSANLTYVWVDGNLVIDGVVSQDYSATEFIRWGEWSNNNTGGTTTIDYIRFDTTGAYAPVPTSGTVVVSGNPIVKEEGPTSDTFDISLGLAPGANVTITLTADNDQLTLNPTTITFDSGNWNVPRPVTVTAVDDAILEYPTHSTEITFAVSSTDDFYNQLTVTPLTVSIEDNDQFSVDLGPYVQFTGPQSAIVHWDTDTPCNSIVEYGITESLGLRQEDSALVTTHQVTLTNLQYRAKYCFRVGYSNGGVDRFTETYWPKLHQNGREAGFDTAINFARPDCSGVASPYTVDSMTAIYEQAAETIISQTEITNGYCLVYGCRDGRLAFELAKRSNLIIVGVDTDATNTNLAIKKLMEAGVYGARVKIRKVASLDNLKFTDKFFNLVVSDFIISDGECAGSAAEMFRVLRPCGGIAYMGQPIGCPNPLTQSELEAWLTAGSLTYTTANDSNGLWSKVIRQDVTDAGWWSHQYGGADNSGNSNDNLQGATSTTDLNLQWIGWPGADSGIDRQPRMPPPVCKNGRLFHQGLNRIMAMDSYNGAMLWSLEIPHLRRTNLPRDAGNTCADDTCVYVAVKDDCWKLHGDTGNRLLTFKLNDPGFDWGCVFRYGDFLYGSAVKADSSFTEYWANYSWYDGRFANPKTGEWDQYHKVCSNYIFANDHQTGQRQWTYQDTNGLIINPSVCLGDGRIYFVESRNPDARALNTARVGAPLWQSSLWLVALDAQNGTKLWEKNLKSDAGDGPVIANGDIVFYMMFANNTLVIECSNEPDTEYYLYGYDADDGDFKWARNHGWGGPNPNHGIHMQRAVIVANNVYLYPNAYSLTDGTTIRGDIPRGVCGTPSGATDNLFYRTATGSIKMWNATSSAVTGWAGIRPGCWLNVISGGGMVLAPEGGGGCCCNVWLNASVGFISTDE